MANRCWRTHVLTLVPVSSLWPSQLLQALIPCGPLPACRLTAPPGTICGWPEGQVIIMLLLLPPFQDRLLRHLWVGAAQIELPVHISMNENVTLASMQWQEACPL